MTKEKAYPTLSPLDSYDLLKPAGLNDSRANREEYQQLVRSWIYLGILTRLDIAFALRRLSQYLADPTDYHMSALKKLSRYIRTSANLGIEYSREGNRELIGYSDSDYVSNKSDRVSILGNIFTLAGAPISWVSKKQKSIATSTMEAEYMAMCTYAKQSQWLAQILRDIGFAGSVGASPFQPIVKEDLKYALSSPARPLLLKGDNQAALSLVKDAHIYERSKHIDMAYHYVRDLQRKRRIAVEYVYTGDIVADGFTKPKSGPGFQRFVKQLGLVGEV